MLHAPGHFYSRKPDVTLTQVGVKSIIPDQLLQVTFYQLLKLPFNFCSGRYLLQHEEEGRLVDREDERSQLHRQLDARGHATERERRHHERFQVSLNFTLGQIGVAIRFIAWERRNFFFS